MVTRLFADPNSVVITRFPVRAPVGITPVSCVVLTTVMSSSESAPLEPGTVTAVAPSIKPEPVTVTLVPTEMELGEVLLILGGAGIVSVPAETLCPGLETITTPETALAGTTKVNSVSEITEKVAEVEPTRTPETPERFSPVMVTDELLAAVEGVMVSISGADQMNELIQLLYANTSV